ncbi:MAG: YaiI/YqxD family protein [Pseudomonadota bacterium]
MTDEKQNASDDAQVQILVDADACPVKDEIYKVALRYETPVTLVANQGLRIPKHPLIRRIIVTDGFDAADDWIAVRAADYTIIITADILLADRCLKAGAQVLAPNGSAFTADSIGGAIAARAIMADLRGGGEQIGGPPPFTKKDRSMFLQALDKVLSAKKRSYP